MFNIILAMRLGQIACGSFMEIIIGHRTCLHAFKCILVRTLIKIHLKENRIKYMNLHQRGTTLLYCLTYNMPVAKLLCERK